MKILITGINGFFGQVLSKILSKTHIIYGLARNHADYNLDLSTQIPSLAYFDVIIHAAGRAHIEAKTPEEKHRFFRDNVEGTKNLLKGVEKAASLPKAIIYISSVAVYGADFGMGISEDHPLNAKEAYGRSKIRSEQIVEDWCKTNNVICGILRLPLLVGHNPPALLGAMIKGIKKGYYFNVAGGRARRSMVMAEDVAEIIPKIVEVGGVYNLTDGYHPTFAEFSIYIGKQLNKKRILNVPHWFAVFLATFGDMVTKFPVNSRKLNKMTSDLTFNDNKAIEQLGWNPKRVLESFQLKPNDGDYYHRNA